MPAIILAVFGFLATALGPLIVRVLASIGIGVLVYKGLDVLGSGLRSVVVSQFSGVPADIAAVASIMGIGVFLSLIMSAYIAGLSVKAATGAFKKIGFK